MSVLNCTFLCSLNYQKLNVLRDFGSLIFKLFYLDEHPKGEAEVERTDSGVGGDMGQSPLRRSWEEIVMKSSEHWSVVAASARHWQELARRNKGNGGETTTVKKKSSVNSITEDMVSFKQLTNQLITSLMCYYSKAAKRRSRNVPSFVIHMLCHWFLNPFCFPIELFQYAMFCLKHRRYKCVC